MHIFIQQQYMWLGKAEKMLALLLLKQVKFLNLF